MSRLFRPFRDENDRPLRGEDEAEERPYWQQRGWQLSAAFLAVALIGGALAVAGGVSDGSGAPVAATDTVRIDAGPGLRPEGCRTDDSPQDTPAGPPDDVTWRQLNGAQVPLSKSAGPEVLDGPLLWCFAHTPMGAVMAANVIPRQMSGPMWAGATEQQVVASQGRDIFVAMRSSVPDTPLGAAPGSLAGFMLVAYSADAATVRILIRSAQLQAVTDFSVVWSGGDWKLRALSSGDLNTPIVAISGLDGFIMWKG